MTIKQTVTFDTSPENLYATLLSGEGFGAATGAPADIDATAGGAISCFGGQITGCNVELIPNQRIVQAWRAGPWPKGIYSIVKFEISGSDNSATLELEHTGYPDDGADHLEGGWHKMYWEPLKAHFS